MTDENKADLLEAYRLACVGMQDEIAEKLGKVILAEMTTQRIGPTFGTTSREILLSGKDNDE